MLEQSFANQPVMHDHVRDLDAFQAPQSYQLLVAWSGTDKINFA